MQAVASGPVTRANTLTTKRATARTFATTALPSRGATKNATGKNGPVVAATAKGTPSTIGIGRLVPVTSAAIGTEQNGPCPTCERAARLPATPPPVIMHGLPPRPATNALSDTSNWLAPSHDSAAPPVPPNAWSPPRDEIALAETSF